MNRGLRIALVAVVCTPMVLSFFLLLMVSWAKMDGFTAKRSQGVKTLVANGILNLEGANPTSQIRAGQLDAGALKEWTQARRWRRDRRNLPVGSGGAFADQQAMYAQQKEDKQKAKALGKRASLELTQGHACEAVTLYSGADKIDKGIEVYQYLDGMGRAATVCGDLPKARKALEEVISKEDDFLQGTPEDALMDMRNARLQDLEFLESVYERQHETGLKAAVCKRIDSRWSSCSCEVTAGGTKCSGRFR